MIIEAGLGDRLMKDAWYGDEADNYSSDGGEDIPILCPALKGSEGKSSPYIPSSEEGCTFHVQGKCELHELGLKPSEGSLSICSNNDSDGLHKEIGMLWKEESGKKLSSQWCEQRGIDLQIRHSELEVMLGNFQIKAMQRMQRAKDLNES